MDQSLREGDSLRARAWRMKDSTYASVEKAVGLQLPLNALMEALSERRHRVKELNEFYRTMAEVGNALHALVKNENDQELFENFLVKLKAWDKAFREIMACPSRPHAMGLSKPLHRSSRAQRSRAGFR